MVSLGFEAKSTAIFQMITDLDADGSGAIDFDEFLVLMTNKVSDTETKAGVNKMFNLFDDGRQGWIDINNLRRVASEMNENIPEDELNEMINRADKDGDGQVTE